MVQYLQLSPDIETFVHGVVSESKTDAAKDEFEVYKSLLLILILMMYVFLDDRSLLL